MPSLKRIKTAYPGVFYLEGISNAIGKPERIYYIRYRKGGKLVEEKAGRQFQDDMTPARAARIRATGKAGRCRIFSHCPSPDCPFPAFLFGKAGKSGYKGP